MRGATLLQRVRLPSSTPDFFQPTRYSQIVSVTLCRLGAVKVGGSGCLKIVSLLGAALAVLVTTSTISAENHPKYCGQVRETASFDLELVAKDKELTLHVADHKGHKH